MDTILLLALGVVCGVLALLGLKELFAELASATKHEAG